MVPIHNIYHFTAQMLDTIDEGTTTAITNHNRLLIAHSDYTVEVKDLLSDTKSSLFSFPTADEVQRMIHCASGNYVATLEGKLTDSRNEALVVRIYTNWEADFVVSKCRASTQFAKRFMRARIAGIVTPCHTKVKDYLDMIEVPLACSYPTIISCCQKTGNLLITVRNVMYLLKKIYLRGHSGKSPLFMDFVSISQTYHLDFIPMFVTIDCFVVSANNSMYVSVFMLKDESEMSTNQQSDEKSLSAKNDLNCIDDSTSLITKNGALHLNNVINSLKERNDFTEFTNILSAISFPCILTINGVNDVMYPMTGKYPFFIYPPRGCFKFSKNKFRDDLVETHSSDTDTMLKALNILGLKLFDKDDMFVKTALQIWPYENYDGNTEIECFEQFRSHHKMFKCVHFLVATCQEGYLFYSDNLEVGLRCVCVFNFTSPIFSVMLRSGFMHVLSELGIQTYNLPTLRSILFEKNVNLFKCTEWVTILGLHSYNGVMNFYKSDDCLVILSIENNDDDIEFLPVTVCKLIFPSIYEVYEEIILTASMLESGQDEVKTYLLTEAYLMLQTFFEFRFPVSKNVKAKTIANNFIRNTLNLALKYFELKTEYGIEIATDIILKSNLNVFDIIKQLDNEDKSFNQGIIYLLDHWLKSNRSQMNSEISQCIIQIYQEFNQASKLTQFLLTYDDVCRIEGHKVIAYLKRYTQELKEKADINTLFILCVLCSQQCLQNDASEIMSIVKKNENLAQNFVEIAINNWKYLFENNSGEPDEWDFSEFTSLLIEYLPLETAKVFQSLVQENKHFKVGDIVKALLKKLPCQVSLEKGQLILQTFLESMFVLKRTNSQDFDFDFEDEVVYNCLKILMRSYIAQLRVKIIKPDDLMIQSYKPIFSPSSPNFLQILPVVDDCNYLALRKLQDLLWSDLITVYDMNETLDALSNPQLKINLLAMSHSSDLIRELIKYNYFELIVPYVKEAISHVKPWVDVLVIIQKHIGKLNYLEQNYVLLKKIFCQLVDHLPLVMNPQKVHSVLQPIMPQEEVYWKCIMKSQQIMFAEDIKKRIIRDSTTYSVMGNIKEE